MAWSRGARVRLERVGMPAYLFRLAHEHGTLFGLLTVFAEQDEENARAFERLA